MHGYSRNSKKSNLNQEEEKGKGEIYHLKKETVKREAVQCP